MTARSTRKTIPCFSPIEKRRPFRRCSRPSPPCSKVRLPWLDALVFLSADDVQCELTGNARNRVLAQGSLQDRDTSRTKGHPRRPHQSGRSGHRPRSSCRHRHQGGEGSFPCDGAGGHSAVAAVTTSRRLHSRRLDFRRTGVSGPARQARLVRQRVLPGAAIHGRPGRVGRGPPATPAGGGS